MSLLLLLGGASAGSITPIDPGTVCAILLADEVAVGQETNIYMQVIDGSGPVALDGPPQASVWGYTSAGVRTPEQGLAYMSQVGSQDLWTITWTPSGAGTFQVVCTGEIGGTAYSCASPVTARPRFDPIGLAVDDVLVSRTGDDQVLGTA